MLFYVFSVLNVFKTHLDVQDDLEGHQDGPWTGQDAPRTLQDAPRTLPRRLNTVQDAWEHDQKPYEILAACPIISTHILCWWRLPVLTHILFKKLPKKHKTQNSAKCQTSSAPEDFRSNLP